MTPGLVSTIIPVFNRPAQLQEAVASVLAQDWRPIEVIIVDNGRGFDSQSGLGGLGLRSMRERVESMAGTIKFESQTGQGARIILSVPISPNSKEGKNGKFNIHPDR